MLPPGVLHMSAVGCFGRFTFSHLAFHIPTLAGSCLCLFCVVVCLVALFLCFWFLFCKCLGIPNSPRSLDLDDRQGLIARSAMQQKKKAVKHLWPGLRPQWTTIYSTLRLEWPGVYDPSALHGKFFDNVGQSDHTQDSQYQGKHWWWVFQRFRANQGVMAQRLTISEPWGFGSWQANMVEFENTLRLERAELASCEETRKANHQYRTPHGTYRIKRTQ